MQIDVSLLCQITGLPVYVCMYVCTRVRGVIQFCRIFRSIYHGCVLRTYIILYGMSRWNMCRMSTYLEVVKCLDREGSQELQVIRSD